MTMLWFKAKQYGWGWYPATWQGWLCIAIYTYVLIRILKKLESVQSNSQALITEIIIPSIILTLLLISISYLTGEKPRWRWGSED